MKKVPLILFILYFITCPSLLCAASRTITITWTMTDTTDVQGYKVYYADNYVMTNKVWHSDCSNHIKDPTNTFTITCNNVDLTDSQTYFFIIAAQMADSSESISNPVKVTYNPPTQLTLVQNFRIAISGDNVGITNISQDYPVTTFSEGDTFYTDRTYVITSLPSELQNVAAIKTANDDKHNTSSNFLTFDVNSNATLYIAYDSGASPNPSWLTDNFTKTELTIATTNYDLVYSVWERTIQAGTVTVPGNKNGNPGSVTSNYFVFVK